MHVSPNYCGHAISETVMWTLATTATKIKSVFNHYFVPLLVWRPLECSGLRQPGFVCFKYTYILKKIIIIKTY